MACRSRRPAIYGSMPSGACCPPSPLIRHARIRPPPSSGAAVWGWLSRQPVGGPPCRTVPAEGYGPLEGGCRNTGTLELVLQGPPRIRNPVRDIELAASGRHHSVD